MQIIPLWGRGVKGKSSNVTAQRRLNIYTERAQDEQLDFALFGRPGLSKITRTSAGTPYTPGTPATGLLVWDYRIVGEYGSAYIESHSDAWVMGRTVNTTNGGGVPPPPGEAYPIGLVDICYNGFCLFMVNGASSWYANATASGAAPVDNATASK
jgi:hypothetical protein